LGIVSSPASSQSMPNSLAGCVDVTACSASSIWSCRRMQPHSQAGWQRSSSTFEATVQTLLAAEHLHPEFPRWHEQLQKNRSEQAKSVQAHYPPTSLVHITQVVPSAKVPHVSGKDIDVAFQHLNTDLAAFQHGTKSSSKTKGHGNVQHLFDGVAVLMLLPQNLPPGTGQTAVGAGAQVQATLQKTAAAAEVCGVLQE